MSKKDCPFVTLYKTANKAENIIYQDAFIKKINNHFSASVCPIDTTTVLPQTMVIEMHCIIHSHFKDLFFRQEAFLPV